jgi:hypothetical protein
MCRLVPMPMRVDLFTSILQFTIFLNKETIHANTFSMHGYNRIPKCTSSKNRYAFPGRQDFRGGQQYWPSRSPDLTFFHSYLCKHIAPLANKHCIPNFSNCELFL